MTCNNYGISGSTISIKAADPTGRDPIVTRYTSMADNASIVVVAAGTNDWMYDWTPLGLSSSTNNNEFYGALNNLCSGLKTKYPNAKILFMTPLKRSQSPYDLETSVNANGKTVKEYGDIIKEICATHGIPVLDMYPNVVINPYIAAQKDRGIPDGTHPNNDGQYSMSIRILSYILQYW